MKRVFLYWGPHKLHMEWGQLISDKQIAIIPRWLPHKWRFIRPITQFFSVLSALYTPRADTYFLEGFMCIIPAYLRKRKDTKIIVINSDTTFLYAPKWKGFKGWIYRKMLPHIDGFISTSTLMRDYADQHHKVPNWIASPYVDERFFRYKADKGDVMIQIGGLRESKGIDMAIEVQKELGNRLILAGPVLEKKYENVKDIEDIEVTGWTDSPEVYLQQAGIYINFAQLEPFGVGVLEGMAAGLIPLVSEHCGVKDAVEAVDHRLVVPLDKKVIVNRLKWLMGSEERAMLSARAKRVASRYTKDESMKQFLQAFTQVEAGVYE